MTKKLSFIKQTGRNFTTRYKENESSFRNKQSERFNFSNHLLPFTKLPFIEIDLCEKGLRLAVLEQMKIITQVLYYK